MAEMLVGLGLVLIIAAPIALVEYRKRKQAGSAGTRLILLSLLPGLALMMIGAGLSDPPNDTAEGQRAETAPAEEDSSEAEPSYMLYMPDGQDAFHNAILAAIPKYENAANELKKSAVLKERDRQLGVIVSEHGVRDWFGQISDFGTTGEGNAYVVIEWPDAPYRFQTWNNELSDISANSLIKHGSQMYELLADLEEGDWVAFSGRFIDEGSVFESSKINDADFILRFSSIRPITEDDYVIE